MEDKYFVLDGGSGSSGCYLFTVTNSRLLLATVGHASSCPRFLFHFA